MSPLAIKPKPVHRETIPSFVSRMAAMNRVNTTDFCIDMGFSMKRLVNPDTQVLEIISQIAELDHETLTSLKSWTAIRSGEVRMTFRGEKFVSRAVRNPQVRGCPICLQDDAESNPKRPLEEMAMRGDWQLRDVSICVKHGHPLVTLWERKTLTDRYNISARLNEISDDLLAKKFEKARTSATSYDVWLDRRLEDGSDKTWLTDQTLYAATTFCQLLGKELSRFSEGSDVVNGEGIRTAQELGFAAASDSRKAIDDAFTELAAHASNAGELPNKAFGNLYTRLARAHQHDPAFDHFRLILWESIVRIWPVASNDEILGHTLRERQLHSLQSAADEVGVGVKLLDQLLVEVGAYDRKDQRPATRKTFPAPKYSEFLAGLSNLVGPNEIRDAMGATRPQFKSLIEGKLLVPITNIPTVKSPWRIEDGLNFLKELESRVTDTVVDDQRWEILQQAQSRSKLSVGFIINAIREGRLGLAKFEGLEGYRSFCVLKSDIDRLAIENTPDIEPASKLPNGVVCTASAFGRSVGMRENEAFVRLIRAGHTPASHVVVSRSGGERFYVTEHDISKFHERFVTQSTLAIEQNAFWRTLLSKLQVGGVAPFSSKGEEFGHLYLRADTEAFFADLRNQNNSG